MDNILGRHHMLHHRNMVMLLTGFLLCAFVIGIQVLRAVGVESLGTLSTALGAGAVVLVGIGYAYGQLQSGRNRQKLDKLKMANEELEIFQHRLERQEADIQLLRAENQQLKGQMDFVRSVFSFDSIPPGFQLLLDKEREKLLTEIRGMLQGIERPHGPNQKG